MHDLPDGSVGLIVTSPPYFVAKDYSKDGHQSLRHSAKAKGQIGDIEDFQEFLRELLVVWRECARVLRPNGKLVINTPLMPMLKRQFTTHENRHIFDLNAEIQHSILGDVADLFLLDTYIWNRTNPSKKLMFGSYPYPTNFYAQNTVEFVSAFVKAGKPPVMPREVRDASRLSQDEWVTYTKQIWDIPVPNKGDSAFGVHSALMPEELARRCIRLFSFVGDLVLDPFAGSGTTLKVARDLGRRFVGYELVESYRSAIELKVGSGVCIAPSPAPAVEPLSLGKERGRTGQKDDWLARNLDSIVVADCIEFLERIPPRSVDLACVDPPYNLGKGTWDKWSSLEEFMQFTRSWLSPLLLTLKPGAGLFVFNTPQNAAHILVFLEAHGCRLQNWITWDKRDGFTATRRRFVPAQETILYLTTPGGLPTFNADAVRVAYQSTDRIAAAKKTGILKNGKRWYPNEKGRLCSDVWHISSERHKTKESGRVKSSEHPTPKPLDLIERIILAASNPGDVVLDCFVGTGTVPVAAAKHGRHFLACDTDVKFVKLAKERVAREVSGPGDASGQDPSKASSTTRNGDGSLPARENRKTRLSRHSPSAAQPTP